MIRKYLLALLSAVALYSIPAMAVTQTVASMAATQMGPLGLKIDLGLSMIPGVTTGQVRMYYNLIAFCIVFLVATFSDSRCSAIFGVLVVIFSALMKYIGWFTAANEAASWGLIGMGALLAGGLYMAEKKRVTYGVTGGGDILLNIVVFILLFQATVGLVNGAGIFGQNGILQGSATQVCANDTYSNCQINGNVQLQNAAQYSGTSSFTTSGGGTDLVTAALTAGWTLLMGVIQIIASVFLFSLTLLAVFPWLNTSQGLLMLGVIQVGIYFVYIFALWRWIWKPMPGDAKV